MMSKNKEKCVLGLCSDITPTGCGNTRPWCAPPTTYKLLIKNLIWKNKEMKLFVYFDHVDDVSCRYNFWAQINSNHHDTFRCTESWARSYQQYCYVDFELSDWLKKIEQPIVALKTSKSEEYVPRFIMIASLASTSSHSPQNETRHHVWEPCSQSNQHFMIINYNPRVVIWANL